MENKEKTNQSVNKNNKILILTLISIICILSIFSTLYFINLFQKKTDSKDFLQQKISDVIKVNYLNTVYTDNLNYKPSTIEIMNFVRYYNDDKKILWNLITVKKNSISENSAVLKSLNQKIYNGTIKVTYKTDKKIYLKTIFNEKWNIGEVEIEFGKKVTEEQINERLVKIIPTLDINHLSIKNIDQKNNKFTLLGDDLVYSGICTLAFEIKTKYPDLKDKITEKDLGIIKLEWDKKLNDDKIYEILFSKNPSLDPELDEYYIDISNISDYGAILEGKNKYAGKVEIKYNVDRGIEIEKAITKKDLGIIEVLTTNNDFDNSIFEPNLREKLFELNDSVWLPYLAIENADQLNKNSTTAMVIPSSSNPKNISENHYLGQVKLIFSFHIIN